MILGRILAAGVLAFPAFAAPQNQAQDTPSLQDLLRTLRRQRDEQFAARRVEIQQWIQELEMAGQAKSPPTLPAAQLKLREVGDEYAPLLIEYLDPGSKVDRATLYRARKVGEVLKGMDLAPVVDGLLAAVEDGNLGAIEVLAATPVDDRPRVFVRLKTVYEDSKDANRRTRALTTLVELQGEGLEEVLRDALSDSDDDLAATALQALIAARSEQALPWVHEFVKSPGSSAHVHAVIDYYLLFDDVDEEHGADLLRIALRNNLNLATRIEAVERMRKVSFDDRGDVRSVARELEEHTSADLREAALVFLAYKGDGGAKRDLIKKYTDIIQDNQDWAGGYTDRGEVYYKIGDYRKAYRDYKDALELQANRSNDNAAYIGAARSLVMMEQYKQAAEYLSKSPLSRKTLLELAEDPDFAEMAAQDRYRRTFGLPERE